MNTQDENNKQDQSAWKKYFSGKNFLINGLIAIIPASLVIGILRELGLRGALVTMGILFGFVYLAGLIREKITNKNKKNKEKSSEKNFNFCIICYFYHFFYKL